MIGCTARQLVREELPAETVRTQERAKLEGLRLRATMTRMELQGQF